MTIHDPISHEYDANAKVLWLRQKPPYYTPPDPPDACIVDDEFSESFRDDDSGRKLVLVIAGCVVFVIAALVFWL